MKTKIFLSISVIAALTACSGSNTKSDAYGNFEAVEILVSAETQGRLLQFNIEEGQALQKDQIVGVVDTLPNVLRKMQLLAQKDAASSRLVQVQAQIEVQEEQKRTLQRDKERFEKLVADNAAPAKQLDDIKSQMNVTNKQVLSTYSQNQGIAGEIKALQFQIAQVQDLLAKSQVKSPISGIVLEKYMEVGEIAVPGKTLFKVADLSVLKLKVYVSGDQLPHIILGQKVKVFIDSDKDTNSELEGHVTWISQQAEFTPKIIQTKDERVNLVYAIKVDVANNGALKIGMPGEVKF